MNKLFLISFTFICVISVIVLFLFGNKPKTVVTTFDECKAAGNPILESYPPQCRTSDGKSFTQDVGNEMVLMDSITIAEPRPNAVISSPLTISGKARGTWFFEASFPILLEDEQGREIARGVATAQGEWMTEEFVIYTAELTFAKPDSTKGTLVLKKDNPSGMPENDNALRVPVIFE
jgi:hypothetical protein